MKKSRKQYAAEAAKELKRIKRGLLKGKDLANARSRYHYLERRAKGVIYERPKKGKKVEAATNEKIAKIESNMRRRRVQRPVAPGQGFLPMFLAQLDMVKIEELVADRLFRTVLDGNATGVAPVSDVIKSEMKSAAKRVVRQRLAARKAG